MLKPLLMTGAGLFCAAGLFALVATADGPKPAIAASAAASSASPEPVGVPLPPPSSTQGRPRMAPPSFADIDTNKDGSISPAEFEAFRAAHRPKGAPSGDGQPQGEGGREGFRGDGFHGDGPHGGWGHGPHGMFDLKALDTNGDGKISLDEFLAPMKEHFNRMDANHDGVLEADELPKPRDGEGDGPPPPPPGN